MLMNQQIISPDPNVHYNDKNQSGCIFQEINKMGPLPKEKSNITMAKEKNNAGNIEKGKVHGNKKGVRKQFTKEEDQQLLELVEKYGEEKWKLISKHMPNRSTRQCHERYKYFLSPKLSNRPWTDEECMILEYKYQELFL